MRIAEYIFPGSRVSCIFDTGFAHAIDFCGKDKAVVITDDTVYSLHREKLDGLPVIRIRPGEEHKVQATVDRVIRQLLDMEAGRDTLIIGIGGGVVTDIAGFVASVYKRGVKLALAPTTVLGMVDAAIGGKNGIDVDVYKNMVGTFYQPGHIIYDMEFLSTLPVKEWVNGFAEIIKHACIRDKRMFEMLERHTLHDFQSDLSLVAPLIELNVKLKMDIVTRDEFENGVRRLLNFGHTIGHAIENLHGLPHGSAVSIGMVAACNLAEQVDGLHFEDARRVVKLLSRYHLPVDIETDYNRVLEIIRLDKKRESGYIHFILPESIGHAAVQKIDLEYLREKIQEIL